jgi:hypothetical protein
MSGFQNRTFCPFVADLAHQRPQDVLDGASKPGNKLGYDASGPSIRELSKWIPGNWFQERFVPDSIVGYDFTFVKVLVFETQ